MEWIISNLFIRKVTNMYNITNNGKILEVIPDLTATLVFQLFLIFYQPSLYPSLLYPDHRRGWHHLKVYQHKRIVATASPRSLMAGKNNKEYEGKEDCEHVIIMKMSSVRVGES